MVSDRLRKAPVVNKEVPVNAQIRARNVRIVDENGNQMGVVPFRDALNMANGQNLDLIQISGGEVPVCRIGDAGKFLFERKKVARENARRQREIQVEIKEIQLRPVTDTNDLLVKARRANDFLADGDKVKIVVRFRGRERAHKEHGRQIIDAFLSHIIEYKIDRHVSDGGKDLNLVIAPVKTKSEMRKEKKT
jgi:translation initiation factor IF-3